MTKFATFSSSALRHMQALAVFAICIGTGAALPIALISFQAL